MQSSVENRELEVSEALRSTKEGWGNGLDENTGTNFKQIAILVTSPM